MTGENLEHDILMYAYRNHGLFKMSSFKYIMNAPEKWREKDRVLNMLVARGFLTKVREPGHNVFYYYLTQKAYNVLGGLL